MASKMPNLSLSRAFSVGRHHLILALVVMRLEQVELQRSLDRDLAAAAQPDEAIVALPAFRSPV